MVYTASDASDTHYIEYRIYHKKTTLFRLDLVELHSTKLALRTYVAGCRTCVSRPFSGVQTRLDSRTNSHNKKRIFD